MDTARAKREARLRRHRRVRRRVLGTSERPRLAVFRSNRHIYAQIIDDMNGRTVASAGSLGLSGDDHKTEEAKRVGAELARRAKQAGVSAVVFDRGGYQYHGRVQARAPHVGDLVGRGRATGRPATTGVPPAATTVPSRSSRSAWSRSTASPRSSREGGGSPSPPWWWSATATAGSAWATARPARCPPPSRRASRSPRRTSSRCR